MLLSLIFIVFVLFFLVLASMKSRAVSNKATNHASLVNRTKTAIKANPPRK